MRHVVRFGFAAVLGFGAAGFITPSLAKPALPSIASAQDVRLTAFLDREFAQELKLRPQLATRLGIKDGEDKLDDISDAAVFARLEWRRASVARMKEQFVQQG